MSTALLTDRYELTMIDAALRDGTAGRPCVFELFARRQREGWTCWGNDADRFDAQNRHPATVRPRL